MCFFVFDVQNSSVIFELTIGNNAEHPTHPKDASSGMRPASMQSKFSFPLIQKWDRWDSERKDRSD
jgi:hypothetical protein